MLVDSFYAKPYAYATYVGRMKTYLGPYQTSIAECPVKIGNSWLKATPDNY